MKLAVSLSAAQGEKHEIDLLPHKYVTYLQSLGFTPLLVPNVTTDPAAYVDAFGVDGVVLTGGPDIDPAVYGQPNQAAQKVSPLRDSTEARLLAYALDLDLPLLGICRGMQFITVSFGGQLIQDLPTMHPSPVRHDDGPPHPVTLVGARFTRLLDAREIVVNSHHHQGATADMIPAELEIFAVSEPDGIVEGVVHRQRPVLGVQWHPEMPESATEADRRLITALLTEGAFWTRQEVRS